MRVLVIIYGDFPREPRTRKEVESLVAAGHEVTVLAVQAESQSDHETICGATVLREPVTQARGSNPFTRKKRTREAVLDLHRRWYERVRALGFDVIQAQNLDTLAFAVQLASERGARVVYDALEFWVEYQKPSLGANIAERIAGEITAWYWARQEQRLLRSVDAVICVNPFVAAEMSRRYGIGVPKVVLNVPWSAPPGAEPLSAVSIGVPVVYAGVLSRGRGLETLVDAVARVDEVSLMLLGDGVLRTELQARISMRGIEGRAVVAGPVPYDRVIPMLRSARIGVIPFEVDTLNNFYAAPNKLFEYMQAGLAIVASDLPFLAWVLDSTGAGMTYRPGDAEDLARVLRHLATDAEERERLRRASEAASEQYVWDREQEKYLRIYDRLRI